MVKCFASNPSLEAEICIWFIIKESRSVSS